MCLHNLGTKESIQEVLDECKGFGPDKDMIRLFKIVTFSKGKYGGWVHPFVFKEGENEANALTEISVHHGGTYQSGFHCYFDYEDGIDKIKHLDKIKRIEPVEQLKLIRIDVRKDWVTAMGEDLSAGVGNRVHVIVVSKAIFPSPENEIKILKETKEVIPKKKEPKGVLL